MTNRVASCGDKCVKLIDMNDSTNDWKEIKAYVLEKETGSLDSLAWADGGKSSPVAARRGACSPPHDVFPPAARTFSHCKLNY